jgi:hypothetical protein
MSVKKVAAIVTVYTRHSHADVLVSKILEGFHHDGGARPDLELVSLYTDQLPPGELSRSLAARHGFTIYPTIAETLTRGGRRLAVDGVLCIGEHGQYPTNDRGQVLYPRRWFFDQVTQVFARSGRVVPVFVDKHLSATWTDARWMYDRARQLAVPLLAGSSLPLTWRRPALQLPRDCEIRAAVQVGYGPLEGYGFHALEGLQCMVERRKGAETGVRAVRCLERAEMIRALDRSKDASSVMQAALELVPAHAPGDYRQLIARADDAALFQIEYRDGLQAMVLMPNGWIYEGDGGGFTFAAQLRGRERPTATHFYLQQPDPFGHFAYLLRAIEALIQTGRPPYPVERTLLTTGILDALMTSRAERGRRIETPHLAIRYQASDWPFATGAIPRGIKRG